MRGRLGFSSCISKRSYRLSDSATTREENLEEGIELVHPPCPGLCDVTARSKENICFSVAQNDSSLHCSVMFRLHFVLVYSFCCTISLPKQTLLCPATTVNISALSLEQAMQCLSVFCSLKELLIHHINKHQPVC